MKWILITIALLLTASDVSADTENGAALAINFQHEVDIRLDPPPEVQARYAQLLEASLKNTWTSINESQYVLLVDRSPNVQAIFLYWIDSLVLPAHFNFIGASPVSTGRPGKFDYFITPLGVFAHTLENRDFRAEGTKNTFGIRGYGRKGTRVFDFGWVQGTRGWGDDGMGQMRLLLHATDPDYLEHHLGMAMSKGCVRIPATLNKFIDQYGLIDEDYEQAMKQGTKLWVLRPDRTPTPWSGRYLVIIDSGEANRPLWSPMPAQPHTAKKISAMSKNTK